MKRFLTIVLALCLLCTLLVPAALAADTTISGDLIYCSQYTKKPATTPFTFDEVWFSAPATTYNHDLAKMSMYMTMASADMYACRSNDRAYAVRMLFDQLGFAYTDANRADGSDSKDSLNYPSPSDNTIGSGIGWKTITGTNGETFTLLAVAIRSSNYNAEWAGNFNVGGEDEHTGFAAAADQVVSRIQQVITDQKLTGKIKIWVSGYSRGAATTNLVGKRLDDLVDAGKFPGLSRDGVYAYSFETPQTVRTVSKAYQTGNYNNIFNIFSNTDIVTKVPPASWNYARYGIDLFIPTHETSADYAALEQQVIDKYAELLERAGLSASESRKLAEEDCVSVTVNKFGGQGALANAVINGLNDWATDGKTGDKGVQSYLQKSQSNLMLVGWLIDSQGDVAGSIFNFFDLAAGSKMSADVIAAVKANAMTLAKAHYAERCFAWMNVLTGIDDYVECCTRNITVQGAANIDVYRDGKLAAQFKNGVAQPVSGSAIPAFSDAQGNPTVSLPRDGAYTVKITATANGTIRYIVMDYNTATDASELMQDKSVSVNSGDVLNGTVARGGIGGYPLVTAQDEPQIEIPFTDVPESAWYYDDVCRAYGMGLVEGTSADKYSPNGQMTLAQAITLAARMHASAVTGEELENGSPWYAPYVEYCLKNGIISESYSAAELKAPVTRGQYAEIFAKALPASELTAVNEIPDGTIPDVPVSHENAEAIYLLYRAGIVNGRDDYGTFYPDTYIKRCEIAAVLVRMMDASVRVGPPAKLGA